jgi:hypothetical protein
MACIISIDIYSIDINGKNGGFYRYNSKQNGQTLLSSYATQRRIYKTYMECFNRVKKQDNTIKDEDNYVHSSNPRTQQYLVQCVAYLHRHSDNLDDASDLLKSFSQKTQSIDFIHNLSNENFLRIYMLDYEYLLNSSLNEKIPNYRYYKMLQNVRISCNKRTRTYDTSYNNRRVYSTDDSSEYDPSSFSPVDPMYLYVNDTRQLGIDIMSCFQNLGKEYPYIS